MEMTLCRVQISHWESPHHCKVGTQQGGHRCFLVCSSMRKGPPVRVLINTSSPPQTGSVHCLDLCLTWKRCIIYSVSQASLYKSPVMLFLQSVCQSGNWLPSWIWTQLLYYCTTKAEYLLRFGYQWAPGSCQYWWRCCLAGTFALCLMSMSEKSSHLIHS